jgi:hypothetical protein
MIIYFDIYLFYYSIFLFFQKNLVLNTMILSNFRRTRTVLHNISSYQTQTAPNYFYNKTRVRGVESNYRTIIKN